MDCCWSFELLRIPCAFLSSFLSHIAQCLFRIRSIIYLFIWYLVFIALTRDHSIHRICRHSIHISYSHSLTLTHSFILFLVTEESLHFHICHQFHFSSSSPFCDLHRYYLIKIFKKFPGVRWYLWYYYYLILALLNWLLCIGEMRNENVYSIHPLCPEWPWTSALK